MELNSIIFPAPTLDRVTDLTKFKNELIFIPKIKDNVVYSHIPCMIHECRKNPLSNKYLLYFHGNAEDIFNSNYTVDLTRTVLPYNTISVEYPGYSIYNEEKSHLTMEEDSIIIFDYLVKTCGIKENDIIICGRSIGSGPSVHLCANRIPGGLVLISPFTSISDVVKYIVGGFVSLLIKDRFPNLSRMDKIKCPILFIHGQKDDIVPFQHSIDLSKKCQCPIEVILPDDMDHNEIHIYDDFLEPLTTFLQRHKLLHSEKDDKKIEFSKDLYKIPETSKVETKKDLLTHLARKFFSV